MNKTLILLILVIIVLCWNFIFTDKKIGLTDQAKILQGLSSAISYKSAIEKYWTTKGHLPNHEDWIAEKPGVVVDLSMTIVNSIHVGEDGPGVISVIYTARDGLEFPVEIDGKKIMLIPDPEGEKFVWTCIGTLALSFLPNKCSEFVPDE